MTRMTQIIVTALVLLPLHLYAADERTPNTLEPITDDLYLFRGGSTANHYGTVLVTDDGILVTDTIDPESAQWLSDELKRRFDQPVKYLVYSHSHYDHIGGSELFKDAGTVIVAHENAKAEILEEEHESQWMTKRNIALPEVTFSDNFTIKLGGKTVTVGGTAKGAGMIGPNMATTISVVTTDAAISKGQLSKALKNAIGQSLNRLTVDGHQSTNDTAMILASGLAGNKPINKAGTDYDKFAKALESVCSDLAKQMALDAEGATRMFRVEIKNAATKADAAKAARAVADYDLVKCAVHGADPNWGRIVCAVGSCGVKLNPEKLSCRIGNITVFRNGKPVKFDAKKVSRIIAQKEHTITIDLASGKASDFCYGCDLGREYITINADYHT